MMDEINFSHARILIVGDVMLDRYWFGDTTRISPEAPVPVVHVRQMQEKPGGAANVAVNIANLGAKSTLLSVIGNDQDGQALEYLLHGCGVETLFLRDPALPTTVKLRIIARGQQIVRTDFEGRPDHELLLPLINQFGDRSSSVDTLVFSDYGKGGLVHLQSMMDCALKSRKHILIDPKGSDYSAYRGATIITPNLEEFALAVGRWVDDADFERRAFKLRDELNLTSLLVTRSEEGMSLFLDNRHVQIPTQARQVYDVSGAGDTVISTLAAAIAAGYDIETAARLSNVAAGIVVGKVGTTPITLQELQSHV